MNPNRRKDAWENWAVSVLAVLIILALSYLLGLR